MLYWFVMTLGAELEAGEAVKGMALRLWALPMCRTSCRQRAEHKSWQSIHPLMDSADQAPRREES